MSSQPKVPDSFEGEVCNLFYVKKLLCQCIVNWVGYFYIPISLTSGSNNAKFRRGLTGDVFGILFKKIQMYFILLYASEAQKLHTLRI